MKPVSKKRTRRANPKKLYTYKVLCSFTLEYSFTEAEVEPDPEGGKDDFNPTEKAIRRLQNELNETLSRNYSATDIKAYAESDELIGICDVK